MRAYRKKKSYYVLLNVSKPLKKPCILFLLQKREEASINLAVTEPTVKIVEYALTRRLPIAPKDKNSIFRGLGAGLVSAIWCGVSHVFVRYQSTY